MKRKKSMSERNNGHRKSGAKRDVPWPEFFYIMFDGLRRKKALLIVLLLLFRPGEEVGWGHSRILINSFFPHNYDNNIP